MSVRPSTRYPDHEARHWWSRNDHDHVVTVVRALAARRVLEFGPGWSTLSLIEGGATHIDSCEDQPDWSQVHEDRLAGAFPAIVHIHRFVQADPLAIPGIDAAIAAVGGRAYDLALIDGPLGTNARPPAIRYAMARCAAVLAPTEDGNRTFRGQLRAIAAGAGWDIAITDTGPLSGGFALLTPPAPASDDPEHDIEPANEDEGASSSAIPLQAPIGNRRARRRARRQMQAPGGAPS